MGVSVVVKVKDNKFNDVRIALGVAGPVPIKMPSEAEKLAEGLEVNEENMKLIADKALEASRAIDFWNASKAYKII